LLWIYYLLSKENVYRLEREVACRLPLEGQSHRRSIIRSRVVERTCCQPNRERRSLAVKDVKNTYYLRNIARTSYATLPGKYRITYATLTAHTYVMYTYVTMTWRSRDGRVYVDSKERRRAHSSLTFGVSASNIIYLSLRCKFTSFLRRSHGGRETRTVVSALIKRMHRAEAVRARRPHFANAFGPPRQSSAALGRATGARPVPHSTDSTRCAHRFSADRVIVARVSLSWSLPSKKSPSITGRASNRSSRSYPRELLGRVRSSKIRECRDTPENSSRRKTFVRRSIVEFSRRRWCG